jgi:hypothetical protein
MNSNELKIEIDPENTMRICSNRQKTKGCGAEKPLSEFSSRIKRGKIQWDHICKACRVEYQKVYREENKEKVDRYQAEYRNRPENKKKTAEYNQQYQADPEFKEKEKQRKKEHYEANKEEILLKQKIDRSNWTEEEKIRKAELDKIYHANNKDKRNANSKQRRQQDPAFRLRNDISGKVRFALQKSGGSKRNQSFKNYLPQSIEELRDHLEKLFSHPDNLTPNGEVWMSWNNWGNYDKKTWDDNDHNTWTWQLDHIIPQADLPYSSMEDENFKKCWTLDNLRPYSAKQNILDGTLRTRHKNGRR